MNIWQAAHVCALRLLQVPSLSEEPRTAGPKMAGAAVLSSSAAVLAASAFVRFARNACLCRLSTDVNSEHENT